MLAKYERDVQVISATLARRLGHTSVLDMSDLQSVGRMAVLDGARSYGGYGVSERTWIQCRIRQRIVDEVRRFAFRTKPEIEVVARYNNGDREQEAYAATIIGRRFVPLDDLVDLLTDTNGVDPEAAAYVSAKRAELLGAMNTLSPRDRAIAMLMIFEHRSSTSIARSLGITQSRVCQIRKRILRKLAAAMLP